MDVHDTDQVTSKSITVNLQNFSSEYTYMQIVRLRITYAGIADIAILVLERFDLA